MPKKFFLVAVIPLILIPLSLKPTKPNKVINAQAQESINKQKAYWEGIVTNYPEYRDGWLKLAEIEVKLGNTEYAKIWLKKAQALDPNSPKIVGVKNKLRL